MNEQQALNFGSVDATPSAAITPVFTVDRLWQINTATFAQYHAGLITLDDVQATIMAALEDFDERRRVAAAVRDAEVVANRDGLTAADPRATSARAAALVAPKTGTQRARILAYIVESNGVSDFEIERDLRILPNSLRPRRNELLAGGFIADSGETRQHRGSPWTIWRATAAGDSWFLRSAGGAA
ncbi:hypothetical protein [Amycolatopsis sp. NPDC051071]|uniref:hypothetical protein n=1 Tax=Amycolatopsis sp. NPDC051071 TaxID=3154637 RepID=UPI00342E7BB2